MAKEKNEVTEKKDYVVFSVREPDNRNFLMCYICDTHTAFDREFKLFQETYSDTLGSYDNDACFLAFGWENMIRLKHIFDSKNDLCGNLFGGVFFHKDTLTYATITHEASRASTFVNEMLVGYSNPVYSFKGARAAVHRGHKFDDLLGYRTGAYVNHIIKKCFELEIPIKFSDVAE